MKEGRKYELVDDGQIKIQARDGRFVKLFRIRAIRDIRDAYKNYIAHEGDLGGYIESEDNLSQEDGSWIYPGSFVFQKATVSGNAVVKENCWILGDAVISENARVERSKIGGDVIVAGNASVSDSEIQTGRFDRNTIVKNNKVFGRHAENS